MKKYLLYPLLLVAFINAAKANGSTYSFGLRVTGRGKPIILIPGLKGSADTYNDVVAHYKDHYKCYVITLAGFAGQPGTAELKHPLLNQRDEIIRFIIDQHIKKPVLVGFSFGGSLAMWIASTRPDLIGPLIELDGVPFDDAIESDHVNIDSIRKDSLRYHNQVINARPQYWMHLDSLRHTYKFRHDGFTEIQTMVNDTNRVNQILDWDDKSDYKATWLMMDEMSMLDLRDSVVKINSPILVLGSWRGWNRYKTKEAVQKRYEMQYAPAKNATIVFSANGKHFIMYDDFNWMIAQMDKFLASCY